jgi:FkbM family methyltransferase
MKTFSNLKTIKVGELFFTVRDGTSDFKAIKEVVIGESYERREFKIEPGETWIDIGANCGAFSVWAASKGARVIGFEPDPDNASMASVNIETNGLSHLAKVHVAGLSEKDGFSSALLYRNSANGNLWRNSLMKKWQGGETIKVDIEPVSKYWVSGNCIKLDAEGIEMPILEKYAEQRVKKLVFEWSFDIDTSITRFEKVIDRLKRVYPNVVYGKYSAGFKEWQPSWFPKCRTIWCY